MVLEDKSSHESYLRSEEGHFCYLHRELEHSGWTLQEGVTPERAERRVRKKLMNDLPPRL